MNVRDSEHLVAELSKKEPYEIIDNIQDADLIIINTCSVREKPVSKLFSELGVFNKKKKESAKIGVCGCTASHLGKEIIRRAPYVDFVLGARNISKILDVIDTPKAVEVSIENDETEYSFESYRGDNTKTLINISIGCDKQCTYCIVPATRGKEISIPSQIIINEVKKSIDNGAKEIMLLGQNVNSYGKSFTNSIEKTDFPDLLNLVSQVKGVERVRFTSPHPLHMDNKFLEVFSYNDKIAKHMHMPLQSGSSKILKAMKRGYDKEWFIERAMKLRSMNSKTTIGTDNIVAFPDESEEDFKDTLDVVNQVKFEQIYSFKYSPRPLTLALNMSSQVDPIVASSRLEVLQDLYKSSLKEYQNAQIGKTFAVLIEEYKDGFVSGKAENFYAVVAKSKINLIGKIVLIKTIMVTRGVLRGEITV
jgi:tRNA-2-methylthio-N6-dimethylallyladenosine synthase